VALVVTWKVTLPSLLVVVKTLLPAEDETATREEEPDGIRPIVAVSLLSLIEAATFARRGRVLEEPEVNIVALLLLLLPVTL